VDNPLPNPSIPPEAIDRIRVGNFSEGYVKRQAVSHELAAKPMKLAAARAM
jgi:hypothetical protein